MLRKTLFLGLAAVLALALSASKVQAWGGYHVGYTHVGPAGVEHWGHTAGYGPYGGFSTGHAGAYGYGGYHAGYGYGDRYGAYGGAYHYGYSPYGGYAAGGFRAGGVYGDSYGAGVYRAW